MPTPRLAVLNARKHVDDFDAVIKDHYEAQDCNDCEDFLQMGIDAFEWIIRADEVIRAAIYAGDMEYDEELDHGIQLLLKVWLRPCENAFKWIAKCESLGFKIHNLAHFRECHNEVLAIVESLDSPDTEVGDALSAARDEAIREHRNGETAEFV